MVWWLWVLLGLGLLTFEVLTPGGFFALFFGLAALYYLRAAYSQDSDPQNEKAEFYWSRLRYTSSAAGRGGAKLAAAAARRLLHRKAQQLSEGFDR